MTYKLLTRRTESTPNTTWGRFKAKANSIYTRREVEIGLIFLGIAFAMKVATGCSGTETSTQKMLIENRTTAVEETTLEGKEVEIPKDPQISVMAEELRQAKTRLLDSRRVISISETGKQIGTGITIEQLRDAISGKKTFATYRLTPKSRQMRTLVSAMNVLDNTPCPIDGVKTWGDFVRKSLRQVWFNPTKDFCSHYAGAAVNDLEKSLLGDGNMLVRKIDFLAQGKFAMICPGKDAFNTAATLVHEARHWLPIIVPVAVADDRSTFNDWDEAAAQATERLFIHSYLDYKNRWMKGRAQVGN